MIDQTEAEAELRLGSYLESIGDVLANKRRKASFAMYALGLMGDGERKSMEPIAAQCAGDPETVDAIHQRLQLFISESDWSDRAVRLMATNYALAEMTRGEAIGYWIIDDTGFLKQGKHSVGVQRQYTGSAGKVTNCQVGVSLSVATISRHLPIDFELYLPRLWVDDRDRRRKAKIPDEVQFMTKPELALQMIRRALADGIPRGIVVTDTGYGNSTPFRSCLRELGLDYAVAVTSETKVWCVDRLLRRRGAPLSVKELALQIGRKGFRRITWREGARRSLWSNFAMRRVVPYHDDGDDPAHREDVWLVMEWLPDDPAPSKFVLASLPRTMTKKAVVRIIKQRWRTERIYEDMKDELGLDHFEGRSFKGWHHHVSVALCCYAFLVAEQARRFPPSARRKMANRT